MLAICVLPSLLTASHRVASGGTAGEQWCRRCGDGGVFYWCSSLRAVTLTRRRPRWSAPPNHRAAAFRTTAPCRRYLNFNWCRLSLSATASFPSQLGVADDLEDARRVGHARRPPGDVATAGKKRGGVMRAPRRFSDAVIRARPCRCCRGQTPRGQSFRAAMTARRPEAVQMRCGP